MVRVLFYVLGLSRYMPEFLMPEFAASLSAEEKQAWIDTCDETSSILRDFHAPTAGGARGRFQPTETVEQHHPEDEQGFE